MELTRPFELGWCPLSFQPNFHLIVELSNIYFINYSILPIPHVSKNFIFADGHHCWRMLYPIPNPCPNHNPNSNHNPSPNHNPSLTNGHPCIFPCTFSNGNRSITCNGCFVTTTNIGRCETEFGTGQCNSSAIGCEEATLGNGCTMTGK